MTNDWPGEQVAVVNKRTGRLAFVQRTANSASPMVTLRIRRRYRSVGVPCNLNKPPRNFDTVDLPIPEFLAKWKWKTTPAERVSLAGGGANVLRHHRRLASAQQTRNSR